MSERNSTLPINSLSELTICPVCCEEYEGHILVCITGHAVCQKCKIQLIECPQCKSPYTGTRNYSMEDVVQKVKSIRALSTVNLNEMERIAKLKKAKETQDVELAAEAARKKKADRNRAKAARKRAKAARKRAEAVRNGAELTEAVRSNGATVSFYFGDGQAMVHNGTSAGWQPLPI